MVKAPFSPSVGVFSRQGKFLVLPRNRTTAGVYVGTTPVLTAPLDVPSEQLGEMVLRSLKFGRDRVRHPTDWDKEPHPLWDAAGVHSWPSFVKGTLNCDIYQEGTGLKLSPMKNMGARGGFVTFKEWEKNVPVDSEPAVLGEAIRQALDFVASDPQVPSGDTETT